LLLIAPVTFLVCEPLAVPVVPYLIAEAMASNVDGTAAPVGDPPNIIIADRPDLSYDHFLIHPAPIVILLMVVFFGPCRVMSRKAFTDDPDRVADVMALDEREPFTTPGA
jgi:Na+/H+ antiporter NhaD/arsenite permease-like protein